jgi:DNA-binding MarR family transcriptional regulator
MSALTSYILDLPLFSVLRTLYLASKPLHLREIAARNRLSPSGSWDIMRRLKEQGLISETRNKNKRCFLLTITEDDKKLLGALFFDYEKLFIKKRAEKISLNAQAKLSWIDEAYTFYKKNKKIKHK